MEDLSQPKLQRGHLERVASAKRYTAIWVTDKASWTIFADTALDDALFGKVHRFNTDIEVFGDGVVDACIQLTAVKRMNREAEG